MTRHSPPAPPGLSDGLRRRIEQRAAEAESQPVDALLLAARDHLVAVRDAAESNPFVNTRLAEALCDRLHVIAAHWERFPEPARRWLKAAMAYYSAADDDVPDLESPIGFEDDCEVLNACLAFAERPDLTLDPADFDEL